MHSIEASDFLAVQNELGEGPLWVPDSGLLYWLDIFKSEVWNYQPASRKLETLTVNPAITALGRRATGGFVTATLKGFAFWDGRSEDLQMTANPEETKAGLSFNDGAVDPGGRFWAGTISREPNASLYRFDPDGSVHLMETGMIVSNGIGWSPDQRTMYFTFTRRKTIYAYDYDPRSGAIENRRAFIHSSSEPGVPDGLAVDQEGFIWSSRCGGWKVIRYDPKGVPEREIRLPTQCPTSCAFGGEGFDVLFITTSLSLVPENERPNQPLAGNLFYMESQIPGLPEPEFLG